MAELCHDILYLPVQESFGSHASQSATWTCCTFLQLFPLLSTSLLRLPLLLWLRLSLFPARCPPQGCELAWSHMTSVTRVLGLPMCGWWASVCCASSGVTREHGANEAGVEDSAFPPDKACCSSNLVQASALFPLAALRWQWSQSQILRKQSWAVTLI